jgi:hypothetical protein
MNALCFILFMVSFPDARPFGGITACKPHAVELDALKG